MGCVKTITFNTFPKQGHVGEHVEVCFHYDTSRSIPGTIMRDDLEEPYLMIILLRDGRYVLSTECQYVIRTA